MVSQAEQEALIWVVGISFEILPAVLFLDCFAVLFLLLTKSSRLRSNFEFFPSLLGVNIDIEKAIILMTVLEKHFPMLYISF